MKRTARGRGRAYEEITQPSPSSLERRAEKLLRGFTSALRRSGRYSYPALLRYAGAACL